MRRRPYDTVKRAIDLVVAWTLLIVTLPIQLVVALAVRLRMGSPVLFRQARPGRGGRVFEMVKFRTMLVEDETHVTDDERMTRLGALLRATSLDELPSLLNVLKGDMSIVGNRPLPLYEAELLTSDAYIERFMAPAGLTGLWQVEKRGGAGKMSAEERKQLDIKYAKEFSFWLDMKILCKTLTAFVQKENV